MSSVLKQQLEMKSSATIGIGNQSSTTVSSNQSTTINHENQSPETTGSQSEKEEQNLDLGQSNQASSSVLDMDRVPDEIAPHKRPMGEEIMDSSPPCRKKRSKDQRICKVCGDKALGYNFNAMTCESCKAFFRRNALKQNTPPCLFQGSCHIDMRTRRFCPHCRLIKCYNVGMKRDMILDDTERKARMQKVMENRQRKGRQPLSADQIKEEPLSELDMLPDQSDSSKCCLKIPSNSETSSILERILPTLPESGIQGKCLKAPAVLDSKLMQKDPAMFRIISPAEYLLFEDLGNAYATTLGEIISEKKYGESEKNYQNCNDLINNSEFAVRRLIKFIKQLEDFQQLAQEDQVGLLKACVLSSIMLRSSCFYNIERDSWMTMSGEISTSILKSSTGYNELYELHTQFCRTVKELFKNDMTLFSLVQVICVFNPECKDVRGKCVISNVQDKYIILLKHYLEWEFSYVSSRSMFAKTMNILADIKHVTEAHNAIILQANPMEIEPLMLEVLDLK